MERYSQQVRDEIMRNELSSCQRCIKAELSAILHISGSIQLAGKEKLGLSVVTESAGVARRVIKLIKSSYNIESVTRVEQVERLGKHNRYNVVIPPQNGLNEMIYDLGMMTRERLIDTSIRPELVKEKCCRASYLRGAFLAGGSITDPHKKTYHLELVTHNEEFAAGLVYLMSLVNIKAKLAKRKEQYLVYLKDSEAIGKFLSTINAYQGVIKLEEVKVVKELRAEVNRLVNCETANLEKTLSAAWKQVAIINRLKELNLFNNLSDSLKITAELRLEYPEVSLKELGELHSPPISKSAVNHRLRLIVEFSKKYFDEAGN
ncbi:MAG TPA: DNA-binding protein WhiA [Bacillota bacterium]|jgi:DNA-binding protein WhiA|nr:DNA-binding protein WhiA [Bacillota bacterium]HOL09778.1 DNA-binding protein WhiA [Bacillota bacterium]HPO97324.1 DNA-binding protein WhiA [Bacillota bacterium]